MMIIAAGVVGVALAGVSIWIWYAFFRTQVRAVRKCRESVRTIKPGLVWLGIIPVLGHFFMFWSLWKIAETLRKEFEIRGLAEFMASRVNVTRNFGYAFLSTPFLMLVPKLWHLPEIITLIFLIVYWTKISGLSSMLDKNEFLPDPVGANVAGVQDGKSA
jgi:hypothetical protein